MCPGCCVCVCVCAGLCVCIKLELCTRAEKKFLNFVKMIVKNL